MTQSALAFVSPSVPLEPLRAAREIIQQEGRALLEVASRLDSGFSDAVALLASCRGCVIVTGVGKAGLIGQKLVATLCSTGTRSFFMHPTEAMHGDFGCLGADDVLLVLSHSGETAEVCQLLPLIRERGLPVLALTANRQSTLGSQADVAIPLGRLTEAGLHGLPPTTSTTAMLAVGDALALVVAESREFTPQQFGKLHPGGSLGRRLTPIREVMRKGSELRIARSEATVRDVFTTLCRPGRRTGAVMLIDEDDRLCGLFTDSDLARLLEQRRDRQLDRPISEVMTAGPLTLLQDAILEEAVQLLSTRRLSELPVIDADYHPVGLIDITDVIGLMPAEPG